MLTELILQIEAQNNQLLGPKGLSIQMTDSREGLLDIRKQFERLKRTSSLDYQKIGIVKDNFRAKIRKAIKDQEDFQNRIDELRKKHSEYED